MKPNEALDNALDNMDMETIQKFPILGPQRHKKNEDKNSDHFELKYDVSSKIFNLKNEEEREEYNEICTKIASGTYWQSQEKILPHEEDRTFYVFLRWMEPTVISKEDYKKPITREPYYG